MFTYFNNKQSLYQSKKPSVNQSNNNKLKIPINSNEFQNTNTPSYHNQQKTSNDSIIKLPSNIMAQLLDQSVNKQSNEIQINQYNDQHIQELSIGSLKKDSNKISQNNLINKQQVLQIDPINNIETKQNKQSQNHSNEMIKNKATSQNIISVTKVLNNNVQQEQILTFDNKSQNKCNGPLSQQRPNFLKTFIQISQEKKPKIISQLFEIQKQNVKISSLSMQQLQEIASVLFDILKITTQQLLFAKEKIPQIYISNLLSSTLSTIHHINSAYYENFILQTKQKYNQLVDQSTNLYSKSRQIADYINEFVMSINLFFESEQLLIPAEQIHKAIAELNPQKTQKFVNYLIKIFQSNFDQVIQKRVKGMKLSLQNQLRKSQKQIKQLEMQIKKVSMNFKQKQSIFVDQQTKFNQKQSFILSLKRQINDLNIKLNSLSSVTKQTKEDYNSQLLLLKRQIQRSKKQLQELQQKTIKLQKNVQKKDKLILQRDQQIEKLGEVIKKVKQVENQGMQNLVQEIQIKQKMFQSKIQKYNSQKVNFEHKIRTLIVEKQNEKCKREDIQKQCTQLNVLIKKLNQQINNLKIIKQDKKDSQVENIYQEDSGSNENQVNKINQQIQEQQIGITDLSKYVNKQIMSHLFLSFDDESKQWQIRNNIRNQIYLILGIKKQSNTMNINKNQHFKGKLSESKQNILEKKKQLNKNELSSSIGNNKNQNIKDINVNINNIQSQIQNNSKKIFKQERSIIGKWLGW